jgi:hypothetical protein
MRPALAEQASPEGQDVLRAKPHLSKETLDDSVDPMGLIILCGVLDITKLK